MANRELYGEQHLTTVEVTSERLSDVLAEAAMLVRDMENEHKGYPGILFRLGQQWDVETNDYILYIHPVV